jgi:hypothetical protein
VGFYGHDSSYDTTDDYALRKEINIGNKPDKEDATSSTNVYWTKFGNLAKSLDEEEILEVEIPPTYITDDSIPSNEELKSDLPRFMCENTKGKFLSNPYN